MDVAALLVELYGRIPPLVHDAVDGLLPDDLVWQPALGANTIGWLTWHLSRVQDAHVAEVLATEQIWVSNAWAERFDLEPDPDNHGYGHTEVEMLAVRPASSDAVTEYNRAVHERTAAFLATLTADELDRVVDRTFDPPVTLGVRLVSVADDALQHAGQAAYLRGLLGR